MEKLSEKEKQVLRELVKGLSFCKTPFKEVAEKLNLSEEEVIEITKSLLKRRVIRRLGITLRHNLAGIEGNAMVAWFVPEERVEEVGNFFAEKDFVSHVYTRKTYPEWKYNLYTMIHQKDREKLLNLVKKLSEELNLPEYQVLFTQKEVVRKSPQVY
ncbi:MAG: Lrp/AsnC family transcriptional regulator [Thermodesulfobacteria bacterium]|nr:Lrp/AsnC family transcriptional regulator [Thermodesulfobacteriota bacterium]